MEIKYIMSTSEGKMECEIDGQISATSAVLWGAGRAESKLLQLTFHQSPLPFSLTVMNFGCLLKRLSHSGRAQSRTAAPLSWGELTLVAWATVPDAPGPFAREVFQIFPTRRRPEEDPRHVGESIWLSGPGSSSKWARWARGNVWVEGITSPLLPLQPSAS